MYLPKSDAILIDELPKLDIRIFKKIFKDYTGIANLLDGRLPEDAFKGNFTLNNIKYDFTIYFLPEDGKQMVNTLRLDWISPQGESYTDRIALVNRKSNLISSSSYTMFLTSKGSCRYLYQNYNGMFVSRDHLKFYHYQSQHKNNYKSDKKDRKVESLFELLDIDRNSPYRRNGKRYYKGELTPYGKRCLKYEQRCESFLERHPYDFDDYK